MGIDLKFAVQIGAPVEAVCDVVTDLANMPRWFSLKEVKDISPGPLKVGTRFVVVNETLGRTQVVEYQVTAYEHCKRFRFESDGKHASQIDMRLAPAGGGTRLELGFKLELNRLAAAMARQPVREQITKDLKRLALLLEDSA